MEAHANAYASQLILPNYLVRPWAAGKRATLDTAKALAAEFSSSLTAAAIKLAKAATTPTCLLCHSQTKLAWRQRGHAFSTDFYILPELHQDTDAFKMAFGAASGMSRPRREPADRWVSGRDAHMLTVESQSVKLPDATVLSLISIVAR